MSQHLVLAKVYHRNQGTLEKCWQEEVEQVCRMFRHCLASHEVLRQEGHHLSPKLWLQKKITKSH